MQVLWIMLIPIAIALIAVFGLRLKISLKELVIQIAGGILVISLIWFTGSYISTKDAEILNGQVIEKYSWKFSCPRDTSNPCRNSYSCDPYQVCTTNVDSKGNSSQSCTTYYHTCYVYPWEQNWYIKSNLPSKNEVEIDRVDDQGVRQPDRWTSVNIGDGYSATHRYDNWVKSSSSSLFKSSARANEKYKKILPPKQPIEIYDYYHVNRLITPNIKVSNASQWERELINTNGVLGPVKQIDIWIVMVDAADDYPKALQRQWQGFKKNQSIIFLGVRNNKIEWVDSISWAKFAIYDVTLQDTLDQYVGKSIQEINPHEFMVTVADVVNHHYVRRSMKEFEYLRGDIVPPTWLYVMSIMVAVLWGLGTSYAFHRMDI